MKQNLRIKHFYGMSENAVKTQIWTAVSIYALAAIIRKELALDVSLFTRLRQLAGCCGANVLKLLARYIKSRHYSL